MDRQFNYQQKILVAVEFGEAPQKIADLPDSYSVFQRLSIPTVVQAFEEAESLFVRLIAGRKFHKVLDKHMGYWEQRVPAGRQCFVHYAIGQTEEIQRAFEAFKRSERCCLVGVYQMEPQSSSYPFSFPLQQAPDHWNPGETRGYTRDSIFWFNFFPAQPYLFEKTFAIWTLFNTYQLKEGGECNQLVASVGADRLLAQGVDPFVQVNLNRFTSLPGFFNAAHEAGKSTFTVDPDYLWYGMLLRRL